MVKMRRKKGEKAGMASFRLGFVTDSTSRERPERTGEKNDSVTPESKAARRRDGFDRDAILERRSAFGCCRAEIKERSQQ